jgi:RNA polymerase sigma-70 factor (ECF subfamily)
MQPHESTTAPSAQSNDDQLEKLLATAKSGSDSALGQALTACHPDLLKAAQRALSLEMRPTVGASDVVQDTFVNATKGFPEFRGGRAAEFTAWLRAILTRRIAEIARRKKVNANGVPPETLLSVTAARNRARPRAEPSPSSIVSTEEYSQLIRAALGRLNERDQQVLQLRFRDGLSFVQIGAALELSEDGARMLFTRAVERLRREMPQMN